MFRAKDIGDGQDVIILDVAVEDGSLDRLRDRGRSGLLRCPTCNHPVIVKAGEVKVWHFAHRHDANCPSHHEPIELLLARATLYKWLKMKFIEGVSIERQVPSAGAPRPFDCWVESGTAKIAYWLVLKQMKLADREAIRAAAAVEGAVLHVVPLASMMRRHGPPKDVLSLSTTERECLCASKYDLMHGNGGGRGAIHYLDPEQGTLTTFRAMRCTEFPSQYTGHEITTPLDAVLALKQTGEFVHPGEQAQFEAFETKVEIENARRRQSTPARALEPLTALPFRIGTPAERSANEEAYERSVRARRVREEASKANLPPPVFPVVEAQPRQKRWEAVCIHCGAVTSEWVVSSGDASKCICVACHEKGLVGRSGL